MKKASLVNFFIVIGLLVLCVTTLVLVYALAPESSVLLLEDGFDRLDEGRWRQEVADCGEDGQQFHYVTADEDNRLIADGILHIYPNMTSVHFKTKREAKGKCYSCSGWENSTLGCGLPLFSAKLQTREAFEANRGRVEIRAKIPSFGQQVNFNIGITPNQNGSHPEEAFGSLEESGNGTTSSQIRVSFESPSKRTLITSAITDSEYHIYEISWNEESVSLNIDRKKVEEKRQEEKRPEEGEENISNGTVKLDSGPISKPFYLNVGVGFEGEEDSNNTTRHQNSKRSLNSTVDYRENSRDVEVDYIRIFRI